MFYIELFFYRRLIQSKFGHDHASSLLNLTYKDSSVLHKNLVQDHCGRKARLDQGERINALDNYYRVLSRTLIIKFKPTYKRV